MDWKIQKVPVPPVCSSPSVKWSPSVTPLNPVNPVTLVTNGQKFSFVLLWISILIALYKPLRLKRALNKTDYHYRKLKKSRIFKNRNLNFFLNMFSETLAALSPRSPLSPGHPAHWEPAYWGSCLWTACVLHAVSCRDPGALVPCRDPGVLVSWCPGVPYCVTTACIGLGIAHCNTIWSAKPVSGFSTESGSTNQSTLRVLKTSEMDVIHWYQ